MFNLSLNSSLIGALDKFEKSMVQQNNVLHESLRQSVTASKEVKIACNENSLTGKIFRVRTFHNGQTKINHIQTNRFGHAGVHFKIFRFG